MNGFYDLLMWELHQALGMDLVPQKLRLHMGDFVTRTREDMEQLDVLLQAWKLNGKV